MLGDTRLIGVVHLSLCSPYHILFSLSPSLFLPGASKKVRKKSDAESKDTQPAQESTTAATQPNPFTPNSVRDNAKNAFRRALWLRFVEHEYEVGSLCVYLCPN